MNLKLFSFFCTLLLSFFAKSQKMDYKVLLDSIYLHSQDDFNSITGIQTDTLSVFYHLTLKADVGEITIAKMKLATTLNWQIPLNQSAKAMADSQLFITEKYRDKNIYDIVTDNSDDNYKLTYVFMKTPISNHFIIFKTIYYEDKADPDKSTFSIVMYGQNIRSGKTNERLIKKGTEKN